MLESVRERVVKAHLPANSCKESGFAITSVTGICGFRGGEGEIMC